MLPLFDLTDKVAIITGGAGLLGRQHANAIAASGGIPVIVDINHSGADEVVDEVRERHRVDASMFSLDATSESAMSVLLFGVMDRYNRVDILVNNLSCNPKPFDSNSAMRFETFPRHAWDRDITLGLTSAFVCSRVVGGYMAEHRGGVIVNIASDLSVIAPDQRLYRKTGVYEKDQPVKPVSYSVVKHGMIGLTKYLAAYWAKSGVRVNALSPGGVFDHQPVEFVERVGNLIPMGRMANLTEMQGALVFLCSEASSYMTGQNLIVDGGRTII